MRRKDLVFYAWKYKVRRLSGCFKGFDGVHLIGDSASYLLLGEFICDGELNLLLRAPDEALEEHAASLVAGQRGDFRFFDTLAIRPEKVDVLEVAIKQHLVALSISTEGARIVQDVIARFQSETDIWGIAADDSEARDCLHIHSPSTLPECRRGR